MRDYEGARHRHAAPGAHGPQPANAASLVSARGLTVRHGGKALIEDIDIDVAEGEIVTVIGPNGAGKTTLVRVLLGLERADRGTVRRRPGARIGYVPQRFDIDHAIPMTVERFLRLGSPRAPGEVDAALAEVGAGHVKGRQLARLSGGELQRVVLARALLRAPDLLILDEPARGVDYAGEAELYTLVGELRHRHGLGVLLVSHDLHIVMAQSDRVLCINRHICCQGIPQAVARDPEYARLFGHEIARAFAVYQHHHDHRHDIGGEPHPSGEPRGA